MQIHIREPYYGPHDKFTDWQQGDFGVGVADFRLKKATQWNEKIELTVGDDPEVYALRPETFKKRAMHHNARHLAHNNTLLYIVPLSYLHRFKKKDKHEEPRRSNTGEEQRINAEWLCN